MKTGLKFKCHWHDFDCDHDVLCDECPHLPKDEDKRNYHKVRKGAHVDGWGMPVCPSCNEPTYDNKRCYFCGQAIKLKEYPPKPLVVRWKSFKGVYVSGGLWIYDNGKFVLHAQTSKKQTPNDVRRQLKTMPQFLKTLPLLKRAFDVEEEQ